MKKEIQQNKQYAKQLREFNAYLVVGLSKLDPQSPDSIRNSAIIDMRKTTLKLISRVQTCLNTAEKDIRRLTILSET